MREGWRPSKWGDEISLEYGKAIRGYQDAVAPYRVFGSNGPIGWAERPLAQGPGIILGRKGAYRGVHFSHDPFFVIDTAYYVKPKSDLDMRWLYYAIIHHKLGEIDDGSPIPSTTRSAVYVRDFDVPPLPEQRAIAATLGALDDKIELNRKMNETLEAMARALFRDWFVTFGPTRAKMAGEAPYLSPDLWSLFPDRLDNDGKPEGWGGARLSDFMSFRGGSQPPAKTFIDAPAPGYVRLLQIRDFDSDNHLTFIPESSRLRRVETDDICIGRYGSGTGDEKDSLGRLCRGLSGAINVALVNVIPTFDCREWLATFIGSGDFRRAVSGGSARAVQAGFKKDDLDHIKVVRATDSVHRAFEELGRAVWEKRKQTASENESLAQTRDLLLPRLMSGELRVAEGERVVEEVL